MTRPRASHLFATLLTAVMVVGTAGPALATGFDPPSGGPVTPSPPPANGQVPQPSTGQSSDSGGTAVGSAGTCSVVSSPGYLGLSCGDGSMTRKSVKQILGQDAVPGCWDDKLSGAELEAMNLEDGANGSTWYWERCLKGIDPKTKKIGPDGVHFTVGLVPLKAGDKVVTLTKSQQALVNMYSKDGTIPSPVAGVSPGAMPRVGSWVSFFDGTEDHVEVTAGAVVLRAHVGSITVEPLGEGNQPLLTCAGIGYKAQRGDTAITHPAGCWHKYAASSADQSDNAYPVNVTAHWVVEVSDGMGFAPFNTFDKSQVTNIPVTEIQALVVP